MKINFLLFLCFLISSSISAQQIRPKSSADIYKNIKTLQQLPRVLYLAAHPDDENTGLLSWLVNEKHIETAYLSLTRGDGGQNLIGSEQGASLGLIRTYELLEARKLDGAQQFFTRAIDFGFSKNPDDTFNQWPIDSITADAVWVIRNFQPDIIICRFPPTSAAGHGQHSASAIIAEKAFRAAADPNAFPDQLTQVKPWQAKRLLWNTFRFGETNTTKEDQFKVLMGQYDPLLGMGYGELAGLSRSLHRSQGAGTPSVAGIRTEYFQLVAGSPMTHSLFDEIPQTWTEIGQSSIDLALSSIIENFDFIKPDHSLPALLALRRKLRESKDSRFKKDKLAALDQVILHCAGFMAELVTSQKEAVPGQRLTFSLNTIARSNTPIFVEKTEAFGRQENLHYPLAYDSLYSVKQAINIPIHASITEPYWLASPAETPSLYTVPNKTVVGLATTPASLVLNLSLKIETEDFTVAVPLSYKKLDPIKGDVVEGLRVVPAVDLSFTQTLYFGKAGSDLPIGVTLHANKNMSKGTLTITSGSQTLLSKANISLVNQQDTTLYLPLPKEKLSSLSGPLQATFEVNDTLYSRSKHIIEYGHLPVLQYFTPVTAKVIQDELKVKVTRIGYVPGAGDFIPDFLRLAGLQVTILQESDFTDARKLALYDAIITGVRSLNAEKKMKRWMPELTQYVKDGGTLIMQFNTLQDLSTDQYGPYPFTIGRDRVTEEDAAVTLLHPEHRIFTYPNTIGPEDFKDWVQERGLYFPSQWDERYIPLFEMHDTGEHALQGGTLYTQYGKGHYIYTPLAFFRQLPAGNIGASKLFFNMLSIGK